MNKSRILAAVGTTVGIATAVAISGAGAAHAHVLRSRASIPSATRIRPAGSGGSLVAGYFGQTAVSASLSGVITVPTLTCKTANEEAVFIDFLLLGTDAGGNPTSAGDQLDLSCDGDTLTNNDESGGGQSSPVSPGDVIQFSVSTSPSGDTESFDDETSGVSGSHSGAGFSSANVQTTVQGGYGGKFPRFSPVKFTSVMVDGASLAADDPSKSNESSKGKREVTTSAIKNGTNFTDTFVAG